MNRVFVLFLSVIGLLLSATVHAELNDSLTDYYVSSENVDDKSNSCINLELIGQKTFFLDMAEEIQNSPVQFNVVSNALTEKNNAFLGVYFSCFSTPVDLYIAVFEVTTGLLYFLDSNGNLTLDMVAYEISTSEPILKEKSYTDFLSSPYQIYWLVTPSNDGDLVNINLESEPFELGYFNYSIDDGIEYNLIDAFAGYTDGKIQISIDMGTANVSETLIAHDGNYILYESPYVYCSPDFHALLCQVA